MASATAGTPMADFAGPVLAIRCKGGSTRLFVGLMGILGLGHWSWGSESTQLETQAVWKEVRGASKPELPGRGGVERETGFEPAPLSLGRGRKAKK